MDPRQCRHDLLLRVDRMEKPPQPTGGALQPFMVCSECGAVLYLSNTVNGGPKTYRPWLGSEG